MYLSARVELSVDERIEMGSGRLCGGVDVARSLRCRGDALVGRTHGFEVR